MSSSVRNSATTVLTTNIWPQADDTETTCASPGEAISMPEVLQLSPLHDAAERGDTRAVRELISRGDVALDAKAGGHRAYRTALHRAAGYGHLGIVKELLKVRTLTGLFDCEVAWTSKIARDEMAATVKNLTSMSQLVQAGASPESRSSAHRTPLHEACTGGYVAVVKELLKFITDIDSVDCHGQTAAHLAAFNGEEGCTRALISHGSNMDFEDKLGNTPGHLAASKNHAAILRMLIEEDVDLSRTDHQGRTPAHHAAITGGLESLKVLAHNDINMNSRDSAGWVPALSAAAHDHLACLQFLVFARLNKLVDKDNSGRGPLHLAAQYSAVECLHWLLEYRGSHCCFNPRIQDDCGATPAHYAAQGANLQCLSCLIKHGGQQVTEAQTPGGETPLDFAKKSGKPLAYHRAVDGQVPCKFCVAKQEQIEYDLAHEPTTVEKNISKQEAVIFTSPHDTRPTRSPVARPVQSIQSKRRPGSKPGSAGTTLPKRDVATKYFGEHLFTLPVDVMASKKMTQRKR